MESLAKGYATVRSLVNAMLAVLATLWLNLAAMVTLAGVGRGKLMGVTVAFAGALLILAAGVRPLAELRRTIRWLLGTGAAWLLIWGSLSLLLRAFLHGSQSGYSEALANHGPPFVRLLLAPTTVSSRARCKHATTTSKIHTINISVTIH
jgi:hypothetical protein